MGLLKWIIGKRVDIKTSELTSKRCTCAPYAQDIGCLAYNDGTCIWHPDNDPYGLKDREWVDGQFVKKKKAE